MKILKAICILFLILSNSIISLEVEVKAFKTKNNSNFRFKRYGKNNFSRKSRANVSNTFQRDIEASFETTSTSEGLLDFILGVLSSFYTGLSILFELKKLSQPILTNCINVEKYNSRKKEVKLKLAPKTIANEWNPMTASVKFNFCKTKKQIFKDNSQRTFSFLSDECVVNNEEFSKIKSKFPHIKSEEEYKEECTYFKEMDCDMFKDGVDALSFIDKAMSNLDPIKDVFACIYTEKDKLLEIPEFKDLGTILAQIGTMSVLTKVIGVTLQVVTLGIWGLVKGSVDLVLLSRNIYDYLANKNEKLKSYLLGRITGEAINLAQSLLTGTKKRRKNIMTSRKN